MPRARSYDPHELLGELLEEQADVGHHPLAWALPRSASLVTVEGLMSTQTSGIEAGRMFPVAIACSMVATMNAKPTSSSSARIAR